MVLSCSLLAYCSRPSEQVASFHCVVNVEVNSLPGPIVIIIIIIIIIIIVFVVVVFVVFVVSACFLQGGDGAHLAALMAPDVNGD